jgi:hypothetical protein
MLRPIFLLTVCCMAFAQSATSPSGKWISNLKYFDNNDYDRLQLNIAS